MVRYTMYFTRELVSLANIMPLLCLFLRQKINVSVQQPVVHVHSENICVDYFYVKMYRCSFYNQVKNIPFHINGLVSHPLNAGQEQ